PCEIQRNAFLISSNDNVAKSPFLNDIVATSPGIRLGQPDLQTDRCGDILMGGIREDNEPIRVEALNLTGHRAPASTESTLAKHRDRSLAEDFGGFRPLPPSAVTCRAPGPNSVRSLLFCRLMKLHLGALSGRPGDQPVLKLRNSTEPVRSRCLVRNWVA